MGSVIEGEDVVQDTFARAFVAVDELEERETGSDRLKRIGVAGDNRHPGALRNQGLDQSQAKAAASAGDDDSLIFEAHRFYSRV
jgi:hypothetical protein